MSRIPGDHFIWLLPARQLIIPMVAILLPALLAFSPAWSTTSRGTGRFARGAFVEQIRCAQAASARCHSMRMIAVDESENKKMSNAQIEALFKEFDTSGGASC